MWNKNTYLVSVFAFTVELPVLAHLGAELVHVRRRRRELIVQRQVIETLLEHVALLLVLIGLSERVIRLVGLRNESCSRLEEGKRLRVILEGGLLGLLLGGGLDVLLGFNGSLKLLALLNRYRRVDVEGSASRKSYRIETIVRSGSQRKEVAVALGVVRVLVRGLVLVGSLEVGRLETDVVGVVIMADLASEVQIQLIDLVARN